MFDRQTIVRWLGMTAGLAFHALLLLTPMFVLGRVTTALGDPALVAFIALASLFCGCELTTIRHASDSISRPTSQANERPARRLALATGVTLLVLFWSGMIDRAVWQAPARPPLIVAGGGLMLLGSLLRLAAIRALGAGFRTEFTPAGTLVRHGIYQICRHPSEAGLLSVALGACILLSSVSGLLMVTVVLVPLTLYRVHLEERRLLAAFGDDYITYRRQVRRFLPRVYWPMRGSMEPGRSRVLSRGSGVEKQPMA